MLAASFCNLPSSLLASRLRTTHQSIGTSTRMPQAKQLAELECSPIHSPVGRLSEDSLWWQPDQDMALSTRGSKTWLYTQGLAARDFGTQITHRNRWTHVAHRAPLEGISLVTNGECTSRTHRTSSTKGYFSKLGKCNKSNQYI